MPSGSSHGWGVAGTCLAAEIAKLPPLEGVTLHCIAGHDFRAYDPSAWDRINIGYCFFEHELLALPFIAEAARRWDYIVAGSSWCEQHLRAGGMSRTCTILQGVDAERFRRQPPRTADGRFIVFSGGKFEFRKGQDIVMTAMRTFMQRHADVWLSCAWHNAWPHSLKTMQQSNLLKFNWREAPCRELLDETVRLNGLDPQRVLLHPSFDNRRMQLIYAESDLGLFPNRCEGGNNMVMCEYMACGRAVIASNQTGHADVINPVNAWPLTSYRPVAAKLGEHQTGTWQEASVEEIITLLEEAYSDRITCQSKSQEAAASMLRLNWAATAQQFHAIGRSMQQQRGKSAAM